MRGVDRRQDGLFSYVQPDSRIPKNHPLRVIRQVTDEALVSLNDLCSTLHAKEGRPSFPPEQLLRALLLRAFYSIRSELWIPTQDGLGFRFDVGHRSDLIPATFRVFGCVSNSGICPLVINHEECWMHVKILAPRAPDFQHKSVQDYFEELPFHNSRDYGIQV